MDYYPWDLRFVGEDSIITLLSKIDKYKEKLVKYQGKYRGSIKILKRDVHKMDTN
jgi:hypothetical protein